MFEEVTSAKTSRKNVMLHGISAWLLALQISGENTVMNRYVGRSEK